MVIIRGKGGWWRQVEEGKVKINDGGMGLGYGWSTYNTVYR